MERKLVKNNDEFYELCKYWNDNGYILSIFKNNKVEDYPSEYPCIVMIEEQLSKDGSDLCIFHYVYKSEFYVL